MPALFAGAAFGLILTSMSLSCTALPQDSASEPTDSLAEIALVEIDDSDPFLYALLLDHPHRFQRGTLEPVMRSLYFAPVDVHGLRNKRGIFPENAIGEVGPLLHEAFLQAKPYQKIRFQVQTAKGLTAGESFILEGALHWRFQLIEGVAQYDEFYNIYQFDADTSLPRNWVLVPQEGQRYHVHKVVAGISKLLPGIIIGKENWVVVDLAPSAGEETEIKERSDEADRPRAEGGSLVGRLRLLRELKADGLISGADYQSKVRSLMDAKSATDADPRDRLRFLKELRDEEVISQDEYNTRVQEVLKQL